MMLICGIDPGLKGGLSFYDKEADYLKVYKMPVVDKIIAKKKRYFLNCHRFCNILLDESPNRIVIEKQHPMPNQGVVSTFSIGFQYGLCLGTFIALGFTYDEVKARDWKKDLGVSSDKEEARIKATELFGSDKHWPLKSHDGLAESAMIAYWGHYFHEEL
jgi:Holliday junction resolvasome RuvABC endonuclease subunit